MAEHAERGVVAPCHTGIGHDSLCISMRSACRHTRSQCGSALFLILLAVALFGALYVAVTGSDRGNKDASVESNMAAAGQLISYASLVENAVIRMSLNIPYQNIQYWVATNSACTLTSCRLFDPSGGGIAYQDIDRSYLLDPSLPNAYNQGNNWQFRLIQVENVGTSKPEIALVGYGLKREICEAINRILGISTNSIHGVPTGQITINPSGQHALYYPYSPLDVTADTTFFRYLRVGITGYSSEVQGQRSFCMCENSACATVNLAYRYSFWHVLVAQ